MTWQAMATLIAIVVGAGVGLIYDGIRLGRAIIGIRYTDRLSHRFSAVHFPLIGILPQKEAPQRKRKEFFISLYVAMGDVIFFLLASVATVVYLYHANDGIVRWYLLFGLFLGFLLYYVTIGKITVNLFEVITLALRLLLAYVAYFTVRPLTCVLHALLRALARLWHIAYERYRIFVMKKYTKKIEKTLDKYPSIM